jgi:hypothetical protein
MKSINFPSNERLVTIGHNGRSYFVGSTDVWRTVKVYRIDGDSFSEIWKFEAPSRVIFPPPARFASYEGRFFFYYKEIGFVCIENNEYTALVDRPSGFVFQSSLLSSYMNFSDKYIVFSKGNLRKQGILVLLSLLVSEKVTKEIFHKAQRQDFVVLNRESKTYQLFPVPEAELSLGVVIAPDNNTFASITHHKCTIFDLDE